MDCARRRADVIIVGSGVIGISTALNLKLQGVDRVAVLEPVSYTHLRAHETLRYLV